MKRHKKLFAIKSVYILNAQGTDIKMLEERITLINEANFDKAIAKGLKEAKAYSKYEYFNIFGKKVRTKFINFIDAFEITDKLESGAELYSSTHIIPNRQKLKSILEGKFFVEKRKLSKKMRKHFQHA